MKQLRISDLKEHLIASSSDEALQGLLESSDLTYYELRKFLTVLAKVNKDPLVLRFINSLLSSLASLEVKHVAIPTIKRIKKRSPKIFS